MRVLLLCTSKTNYVLQLYKYVRKYYPDVKYSLLTFEASVDYYRENLELRDGEEIYSLIGPHIWLIGLAIWRLPKFDIIHSMWYEYFWGCFAGTINRKCDYWFASIGGSDLFRETKYWPFRFLQRRILRRCDLISSEGAAAKEYFNSVYSNRYSKIPHRLIRFGVDILDELTEMKTEGVTVGNIRAKYGIPSDKTVIMCGTCGRKEHQHFKIFEAIERLDPNVLDRICLLIPMTYDGTEAYKESVAQKAKTITGSVVVLREFLSPRGMAEVAYSTDIMIHVQTTDQLSSAMISHMFNGNVVIAGSWLPYDELRESGVGFISIDKIEDLTDVIPEVLDNLDTYKKQYASNEKTVYDISSWELSARKWHDAYTFLMNKKETV